MSSASHLQQLIAHYLAKYYPSVLPHFLEAARLRPPDPSTPPSPDLRTLVQDYLSYRFAEDVKHVAIEEREAPAQDGSWQGWGLHDLMRIEMKPDIKLEGVKRSIEGVSASNLLTVQVRRVPKREFDLSSASYRASYPLSVITTSVDKTLKVIDFRSGEVERILEPHRAAILCFAFHPRNPRYLLTGSMDGTAILTDLVTSSTLQTLKHSKFVVRVAFSPDGKYLATASYDRTVVLYAAHPPLPADNDGIPVDEEDDPDLASHPDARYELCHTIKVDSNPEAILFHPQSTWLMYTLRSSHLLYYLHLGTWETRTKNFNPHPSDNHLSFAVLNLALHPSGKILACQTGDHRGGAGERVLLYGVDPEETERLACLWTGNEGDDFVLPRMSWLPDGSGLITTTANGYLNLIALSGETRSSVKVHGETDRGQASSEVVRDCCIASTEGDWQVISVGYDRRVRLSR